ncbi:unnamed protein product [Linum tenue]|uniref:Uncharacterized protein n=1 Tax=Linum tenue TaxID=586396 RepID=A0AAV0R8X1_9ROSI|nr:unnamed protein product [Linum tenue]
MKAPEVEKGKKGSHRRQPQISSGAPTKQKGVRNSFGYSDSTQSICSPVNCRHLKFPTQSIWRHKMNLDEDDLIEDRVVVGH